MDIMGALAVASQTIKVAKELRDIERDMDSATYKAKMAELYSGLADLKISLSDAREELHTKESEIKKLRAEIDALKAGDVCPLCQSGRLKITAIDDDPTFGILGHKQHTLTCQNTDCGHTDTRKIIPS